MTAACPLVGILMGSDSDLPVMAGALDTLREFGVAAEIEVVSAHRSPARASEYARTARERGLKVIICGAGAAAHLAGLIAADTTVPVIGVPIDTSPLKGFDSLLATVQMPPGIPVATMAVGKSGATNAALFAIQILSTADPSLVERMAEHKRSLAAGVAEKNQRLQDSLRGGRTRA
jgi:phosphoribosylaminoimidazole carboxylase PurE protein